MKREPEYVASDAPGYVRRPSTGPARFRTATQETARPKRDFVLRRLLALADSVAVMAGIALAVFLLGSGTSALGQFAWGVFSLPAWLVLFKMYGLYDRDAKRISHSTVEDAPWIFHALVLGTLGLWLLYELAPADQLTLREGITFFAGTFVFVLAARGSVRALAGIVIPRERVLLVGSGSMARMLIHKMRQHPEYGLNPVGYLQTPDGAGEEPANVPNLGTVEDLQEVCEQHGIDRAVVVAPALDGDALTELIRRTKDLDIRISLLPNVVDVLGPSVEIDDVEGITVLGINPPALTRSSRFLKRILDVALASTVLILVLPVLAVMALALKVTSSGPIFYSQERIGRGGRRFRMHKFRTMVQDAEAKTEELQKLSAHPAWLLLDHDPRVTRVGRLLRHASLDELPQLWNVVKGDMSLVGPRPMPPDVDEQIYGWGRRRLDLTPGITGLWQVLGRTSIPFEEMVKLDYLYVTNWSLWQDIRLLIRTLPAVVRRRGVN